MKVKLDHHRHMAGVILIDIKEERAARLEYARADGVGMNIGATRLAFMAIRAQDMADKAINRMRNAAHS